MNKGVFLDYLGICKDALATAIEKTKIKVDIREVHYEYIILHILNLPDNEKLYVFDDKKQTINAKFLSGGYGFLGSICRRVCNGRPTYNKSVKKYIEDNGLHFDELKKMAHGKIKYLSYNEDFAASDIKYISRFAESLSEGGGNHIPVRNFWIEMLSALFEKIQNHGSDENKPSLNEDYKIVMLSELSRLFAKYNDIFDGITGQEDGFYAAASSLYFKLFLISVMDEKTVNVAASFRKSPVSVLAAEDCKRCKLTPVLLDSVFMSSSKAKKNLTVMTEKLVIKVSELQSDKIDYDEFHVLFGDLFFSIANNVWCQENVVFPLLNKGDESALRFAEFYKKAAEQYRERKWNLLNDMYSMDRSYASYRAATCLDCKLPEIKKQGTFELCRSDETQKFMIMRHTSGLSQNELKELGKINSGEGDSSYAKNYNYFIKATAEELTVAARKGHLYKIIVEKERKNVVVGFAIMTVETNTSDEKNKTPYNGKMKAVLEHNGIDEKDYGVLNTIIIDPAYYGYGLQHVLTLLLIRLCQNVKKYIVATVSNRNRFSYHNFIKCRFTDIDAGNEFSGSVMYEIDKKLYPRHLVMLKTNERMDFKTNTSAKKIDFFDFLAYAKLFHEKHNDNYGYYSEKNSQNFVSQCLTAAGWVFDDIFYPQSAAFINVEDFKNYAVSTGVEYIEGFDGISQGDLLITDDSSDIVIVQAVTIIKKVEHKRITGYLKTSALF